MKVPNAPRRVQVIPEKLLAEDRKINLEILKCDKCTLVQLSNKNYVVDDYYDDYIMSRTYSPSARKYLRELASDFVSSFNLKNKGVVDVGCGDGYFVHALIREKAKAFGIEPSDKMELTFYEAQAYLVGQELSIPISDTLVGYEYLRSMEPDKVAAIQRRAREMMGVADFLAGNERLEGLYVGGANCGSDFFLQSSQRACIAKVHSPAEFDYDTVGGYDFYDRDMMVEAARKVYEEHPDLSLGELKSQTRVALLIRMAQNAMAQVDK